MHRAVASTGPRMKATSSRAASREKAAWTSSGRVSIAVQRARTSEPMEPVNPPASVASTVRTPRRMCAEAAATSPARLVEEMTIAGSMIRDWPNRSTHRARIGAPTAIATKLAALTSPAAV